MFKVQSAKFKVQIMHDCFSQLPRHPAGATPSFIKTGTLRRCRSENSSFIYTYFMIKLIGRENMKNCIKFLLAVVAFSPLGSAVAAPISQTAGSNLTGYNGAMGSMAGNQWNTMTNSRQGSTSAKADYGNCEAVILRCAKPKCSGSGCTDFNVAKSIAAGCVNSNAACKKHGDALTEFIAGQLVSSAQAVAQQQQAAAQSAAAQQSAEQISMMQQQMQMQMQQMQEQNNAQMASLQNALEESQRAAAEAQAAAVQQAQQQAAAPDVNTGLTAVQTAAVKSGVSEDTIARATITGQIMSSMEGVDTSLANLKATMREAFRYAGCNEVNGDNCTGPKRVKKFKELSMKFFEPYDALVDNLEDALIRAQTVGVDMSDIYMMLSGSCNRWAEYICSYNVDEALPTYHVGKWHKTCYSTDVMGNKHPMSCGDEMVPNCDSDGKSLNVGGVRGGNDCSDGMVIPPEDLLACSINKIYNDTESYDAIQERWLNPDQSDTSIVRVGCAGNIVNSGILKRRGDRNKGALDINVLQLLIGQDAPGSFDKDSYGNYKVTETIQTFCAITSSEEESKLRSATVSKSLDKKNCCSMPANSGKCTSDCEVDGNAAYINPRYALCNVHAYNANKTINSDNSDEQEEIKKIIGLKSTVVAQQMYKQYTMIESMIKRLKIQLEKATLKASLQVAGGTSDEGDEGGTSGDTEFSDCNKGEDSEVLSCLRENLVKYATYVNKRNAKSSVRKQMTKDMQVLDIYVEKKYKEGNFDVNSCKDNMNATLMTTCYQELQKGIRQLNNQIQKSKKSGSGGKVIYFGGDNDDD